MIDLKGKTVFVTGGSSMIGSAVCELLKRRQANVISPSHTTCDLLYPGQIRWQLHKHKPDYLIHCAGFNGNIGFNAQYPADIFYKTCLMALNVLNAANENKVKKVVNILPSCAYSAFNETGYEREELYEYDFEEGPSHPSVRCHGHAKRILFDYSKNLYTQYGLNSVCCVLNNAYGPNDSFDINKTKVIGGMIKKFVDAQKNNSSVVECFGSGKPRREFIYKNDAAEGIIKTLELYEDTKNVINIGCGEDISILDLANIIKTITGFEGEIFWNTGKPDGQMIKLLNNWAMLQVFDGWIPPTSLEGGLTKTIQWYKENYK